MNSLPRGDSHSGPSAAARAELIVAARRGSQAALGQLLADCRDYLLLVANRELDDQLRVKVGASDLVQETFLIAQRKFGDFRGTSEAELLGWLRQILITRQLTALRHFRQDKRRQRPAEPAPVSQDLQVAASGSSPSSLVIAQEEKLAVEQALEKLPPVQRQVVLMRNWQRKTFVEIGRQLGRSPEAVRKIWIRALERLEQQWGRPNG